MRPKWVKALQCFWAGFLLFGTIGAAFVAALFLLHLQIEMISLYNSVDAPGRYYCSYDAKYCVPIDNEGNNIATHKKECK